MPAPTDLERRATVILDNAYGLQDMICAGCTNLFYRQAKFVGGRLELSDPECLNADCAGHDPVAAYLKVLPLIAYMMGKEVFFASTEWCEATDYGAALDHRLAAGRQDPDAAVGESAAGARVVETLAR